jgi:hypothetical protein
LIEEFFGVLTTDSSVSMDWQTFVDLVDISIDHFNKKLLAFNEMLKSFQSVTKDQLISIEKVFIFIFSYFSLYFLHVFIAQE